MYWSQNSATVPADQTGWTTVQKGSATGNTLTPNLYVGVRVCDGTENGTSFTAAGSNTATLAQISVFRNIDVTTLVEASTLNGTVTATTCTLTGVTTSAAPGLLFYAAAQASTTATATPPSVPAAFTELLDRTSGVRSANAGYLIWSGSGATGDPVVTWTTSARTFGALLSLPHTIARTAVGTQQDTAYDVAAAVGASQATAFNVPAPVGSSQATALDVAAPVGASQATALDVAAPVGASSSTAYDVAAVVGASRATVFDLLDVAEVVNYLAGARFCSENDDVWANMSLYHDNDGDNLWRIIPFDMNASWGQRTGVRIDGVVRYIGWAVQILWR